MHPNNVSVEPKTELDERERQKAERAARKARINAEVRQAMRTPFQEVLTEFMGAAPESEDLVEWARKQPGKWANATYVLAQLAGYAVGSRDPQVNQTFVQVNQLSDSDLNRRMLEAEAKLKALTDQRNEAMTAEANVPRETMGTTPMGDTTPTSDTTPTRSDTTPTSDGVLAAMPATLPPSGSFAHSPNIYTPKTRADDERTIDVDAMEVPRETKQGDDDAG